MQSGDLQQVINCYNIDLGIPTVIFLSCLVQSTLFKCLEEYLENYSFHQLRLSSQREALLPQPLSGLASEITSLKLLIHCQAHLNFTYSVD